MYNFQLKMKISHWLKMFLIVTTNIRVPFPRLEDLLGLRHTGKGKSVLKHRAVKTDGVKVKLHAS